MGLKTKPSERRAEEAKSADNVCKKEKNDAKMLFFAKIFGGMKKKNP